MKLLQKTAFLSCFIGLIAISCNNDDDTISAPSDMVNVGSHSLFAKSLGNGNHTIVFESGLGDNYESWYQLLQLSNANQVIAYNRAGYEPSEMATSERSIKEMAQDLHQVILSKSNNDNVILVGHSLGGAIVRYYAILHPEKVKAILFVDPSHEDFEIMTQQQEDAMVDHFTGNSRPEIAAEARQMIENFQLLEALPSLPDVPVTVLTSIKDREGDNEARWINAHSTLGNNITNFTHTTTEKSGHYIQVEEPQLVLDALVPFLN